jgi:hypothetical protein
MNTTSINVLKSSKKNLLAECSERKVTYEFNLRKDREADAHSTPQHSGRMLTGHLCRGVGVEGLGV